VKRIVLVTTVPLTLDYILAGQPEFLNKNFSVVLVSSDGVNVSAHREDVPFYTVNMNRGISPIKDLVSIFLLIKVILQEKPDVIHSYTPKAGLVSAISAFLCRVPIRIHTFTGLIFPSLSGVKKVIVKAMDKLIVTLNTRIVPEGMGVWMQLVDAGFSDRKFEIIGNGNIAGVDLEYFSLSSLDEKLCLGLEEILPIGAETRFLFVGRLHQDKGIKELVNAFSELPGQPVLILAGGLDETQPPDAEVLNEIMCNPNIIELGHVNTVRECMAIADCLVLPSYREGFPNVVLQAGAMALPAIVTDISGCNEIITHQENGWLVKPRDVLSLKTAMKTFIEISDNELDSSKYIALKNIHQKFDRKIYHQELLSFYRRMLDEKVV
jgi:glycosyltransferase involved in cell wall biosynthesis